MPASQTGTRAAAAAVAAGFGCQSEAAPTAGTVPCRRVAGGWSTSATSECLQHLHPASFTAAVCSPWKPQASSAHSCTTSHTPLSGCPSCPTASQRGSSHCGRCRGSALHHAAGCNDAGVCPTPAAAGKGTGGTTCNLNTIPQLRSEHAT